MEYVKKNQRTNKRNLLLAIHHADDELILIFNEPGETPSFMKPFMQSDHEVDEVKFDRAIKKMQKDTLITVEERENEFILRLTENGKKKALRYSLDDLKINRPEKWDGKWHIVMFDVPNEKRVARNYFKQKIDQLGFVTIQESVYGHPFPCENEIELVRTVYGIKPFVKLMTVEHFEGEEKFLSKFGLGR